MDYKLRAYDTLKKDFFDVVAINLQEEKVYISWNEQKRSGRFAPLDEVILKRFTGLTLSDGTDVYERDIFEQETADGDIAFLSVKQSDTSEWYLSLGLNSYDYPLAEGVQRQGITYRGHY